MRFLVWTLPFVLLSALSWSGASAQVVPGQSPVDWSRERREYTADILRDYNTTMTAWRAAWQRGDAASVAEFYSPAAYLFGPDQKVIQGKAAIQRHFAGGARMLDLRTGLSDFVASERLAYAAGPYWYQQEVAGEIQTISGTYVTVIVRESGRWKIRSQVFTLDPGTAGS